jgi:hypothetical protein
VILDLVMKRLNGIDAAEKISYEFPTTIILTTSRYDARTIIPRLQPTSACSFNCEDFFMIFDSAIPTDDVLAGLFP